MLLILMGLVMAMLWSSHPTASGTRLRRWLVERPAEWLSRRTAWSLAVILLSIGAIVAALHVFEGDGEGLRLVGVSVAEAASWFVAFDVGVYIEAYAVILLLGANRQARAVVRYVRGLVPVAVRDLRRRSRSRARRAPKAMRGGGQRRPPDQDPDPVNWPGLAIPA